MDLTPHITRALAAETARQAASEAARQSAARERDRQAADQEVTFRTVILPALEDCRRQLSAAGIDCELTNGQDPRTAAIRRGLRLLWRGTPHTLVLSADPGSAAIHATATISGEPANHITNGRPSLDTLSALESLVEQFTVTALSASLKTR